ncbi:MAG: nucleotide exchange factor GrpE [Candidatus Saccharimonadales bacterium]
MSKLTKSSTAELQKQIAELTEALQRERADAMNVRRRADQEKQQMADLYKAIIIRNLLPAVDNLERALMHAPGDLKDHDYVKGVQKVIKQFESAFSQLGVERIKTVGERFDPHLHEAVSMEEGDGKVETVCEELQPGYKIGNEIIRHAIVKVKMERK